MARFIGFDKVTSKVFAGWGLVVVAGFLTYSTVKTRIVTKRKEWYLEENLQGEEEIEAYKKKKVPPFSFTSS